MHYNGTISYLIVNSVEIYKFKAKDSEIIAAPLCLGNYSKCFSADNTKKTEFYGQAYDFSANYDNIDVDDILDIRNYLMEKHDINKCLDLLKRCLLDSEAFAYK